MQKLDSTVAHPMMPFSTPSLCPSIDFCFTVFCFFGGFVIVAVTRFDKELVTTLMHGVIDGFLVFTLVLVPI